MTMADFRNVFAALSSLHYQSQLTPSFPAVYPYGLDLTTTWNQHKFHCCDRYYEQLSICLYV